MNTINSAYQVAESTKLILGTMLIKVVYYTGSKASIVTLKTTKAITLGEAEQIAYDARRDNVLIAEQLLISWQSEAIAI